MHGIPNVIEVNPLPGILPNPEDNSEWRFALVGKDQATLDALLFYDAGLLAEHRLKLRLKDFKTDAGFGIELDILDLVRLGLHFPVWVSEPVQAEPRWQLRWVVAFDLTL